MRFTNIYQLSVHFYRRHLQCHVAVLMYLEIGADFNLDFILKSFIFFKEYIYIILPTRTRNFLISKRNGSFS